jgi:hypothetical protein
MFKYLVIENILDLVKQDFVHTLRILIFIYLFQTYVVS